MIHFFIAGILAVLLAYLDRFRDKGFKYGLEMAFGILIIFLSIRYNFGNDYIPYIEGFQKISNYFTFSDILNFKELKDFTSDEHFELGWIILNILCKPIGFFGMVVVLTAFQCFVYYKLIKRYVAKEWYFLSVFIYVFTYNFMLVQASMMRQSLAISLFLVSINYIFRKKYITSLIIILIACQFHRTALILLPFCFMNVINFKITPKISLIILFFSILFSIFPNLFSNIFSSFVLKYYSSQEFYLYSYECEDFSDVFRFTAYLILFTYLLYYSKYLEGDNLLLSKLLIISFLFYFIEGINPVGRLSMYFNIFEILVYSIILNKKINNYINILLILLIFLIKMRGIYMFFNSEVWIGTYMHYQTIFSSPVWY